MYEEEELVVLCAASAYTKKFYLNPEFSNLPESIQQELQIMCVLFTEDVGGTITLKYDNEGNLIIVSDCDEGDLLYDEIGGVLKVKQIQRERTELVEALEMYYKLFFLNKWEEE